MTTARPSTVTSLRVRSGRLMELVLMLSQRLRATSERLLGLMDEQAQRSPSLL